MIHKWHATLFDVPHIQNPCLHSLFNVFIIYSIQALSTRTIVLIPICHSKSCFTWRQMSHRSIWLCQRAAWSKVCIHRWICAANIRCKSAEWQALSLWLQHPTWQCSVVEYVTSLQNEEDNLEAHLINWTAHLVKSTPKSYGLYWGQFVLCKMLFEMQNCVYQTQL